jgi:hypothetical protein
MNLVIIFVSSSQIFRSGKTLLPAEITRFTCLFTASLSLSVPSPSHCTYALPVFRYPHSAPRSVVQMLRILQIPGSNLGSQIGYVWNFSWFFLSLSVMQNADNYPLDKKRYTFSTIRSVRHHVHKSSSLGHVLRQLTLNLVICFIWDDGRVVPVLS